MSGIKNPVFVESGRRAARKRWDADAERNGGKPGIRIVRLDEVDPSVAAVIRALVAADQEAKEAAARVAEQAPDAPETAA